MNHYPEPSAFSRLEPFAVLTILAGVGVTIFWMYVAWRAMRAHEKIAEALTRKSGARGPSGRTGDTRQEDAREEKTFRDFLQSDPLAKHCDAAEQMRRYQAWKARPDASA